MVGDVGEPALRALHGPQNFVKSRYSARILVWAMENETLKSWGVADRHTLSSATKVVDLSQKSTWGSTRAAKKNLRERERERPLRVCVCVSLSLAFSIPLPVLVVLTRYSLGVKFDEETR